MNAQRARGADFNSGGLIKRIHSIIPILIPLFISSLQEQFELLELLGSQEVLRSIPFHLQFLMMWSSA